MASRRNVSAPPPGWSSSRGKAWSSLTPSYRGQVWRAHERGYRGSIYSMTKARAEGRPTPSDVVMSAAARVPRGRWVVDMGQGRREGHFNLDRPGALAALTRYMETAARRDLNVTVSLNMRDGSSVKLGGRGGQSARSIMENSDDEAEAGAGAAAVASLAATVYGADAVALDDFLALDGDVESVDIYAFPVSRRGAA